MQTAGHWGSDLEALACAQVFNIKVVIWSLQTCLPGEVLNETATTQQSLLIHLLHSGNHYEGLQPLCNAAPPPATSGRAFDAGQMQQSSGHTTSSDPFVQPQTARANNQQTHPRVAPSHIQSNSKTESTPSLKRASNTVRQSFTTVLPESAHVTHHELPDNDNVPSLRHSDHLNILNWNCQGLNAKLNHLPNLLNDHDIHVAVLTETQRTVGTERANQTQTIKGYTFYFSSYKDKTHTASFRPSRSREWGVCIVVKTGLTFQPIHIDTDEFKARVIHGTLTIPTETARNLSIDLIAVYAPAQESARTTFWRALSSYVCHIAAEIQIASDRNLILAGDWNSYVDPTHDIYRIDPVASDPPSTSNTYLKDLLNNIEDAGLPLIDIMRLDKLSAFNDFTFSTSTLKYRSILDKIFTNFAYQHCEPTEVLDWHRQSGIRFSDHRPVRTCINLSTLCKGWIEYPEQPLTRPRIKIDTNTVSNEHLNDLLDRIEVWRRELPTHVTDILFPTSDTSSHLNHAHAHLPEKAFEDTHSQLTTLFADIPSTVFETGSASRSGPGVQDPCSWTCTTYPLLA